MLQSETYFDNQKQWFQYALDCERKHPTKLYYSKFLKESPIGCEKIWKGELSDDRLFDIKKRPEVQSDLGAMNFNFPDFLLIQY